jgi:predicted amidohydrolase YtcJ
MYEFLKLILNTMKKNVLFLLLPLLAACNHKPKAKADLIIHHALIYTVDQKFSTAESMAIKDGKILALGSNDSIGSFFEATETVNAGGKPVVPGLIDAHCHFFGYGMGLQEVDLTGTKSFDEVIQRIREALKAHPAYENGPKDTAQHWICGRGWDQNNWAVKEFPVRDKLDSLFPYNPIKLTRIDGHALISNKKALDLAGISGQSKIAGGMIVTRTNKNGTTEATGVLVDNAMSLIDKVIPPATPDRIRQALKEAQAKCFEVGLTTLDDAGLDKKIVDLINEMQTSGELKMRIYAMLSDNEENFKYYLEKGPFKTDRLNVRSFKFYADGALGSRGACLLKPYADKPGQQGFLLKPVAYYKEMASRIFQSGFQMNTHCIGDSAVRLMLSIYCDTYDSFMKKSKSSQFHLDSRWRIEHFQVSTSEDIARLSAYPKNIIPSIQPTHATSDMYWAGSRLGTERLKWAYAYNAQLKAAGILALGTDFPVEDISPFKTFYAATARMDSKGFPAGGFQIENALSREDALRGMTIWAAYSNFEEKEKGSLEPGKLADFVILDTDLMKTDVKNILGTRVIATYINGEKVFGRQ